MLFCRQLHFATLCYIKMYTLLTSHVLNKTTIICTYLIWVIIAGNNETVHIFHQVSSYTQGGNTLRWVRKLIKLQNMSVMSHLAIFGHSIHLYLPGTADELGDDHWMLLWGKMAGWLIYLWIKGEIIQSEQWCCLMCLWRSVIC